MIWKCLQSVLTWMTLGKDSCSCKHFQSSTADITPWDALESLTHNVPIKQKLYWFQPSRFIPSKSVYKRCYRKTRSLICCSVPLVYTNLKGMPFWLRNAPAAAPNGSSFRRPCLVYLYDKIIPPYQSSTFDLQAVFRQATGGKSNSKCKEEPILLYLTENSGPLH